MYSCTVDDNLMNLMFDWHFGSVPKSLINKELYLHQT